VIAFVARRLVHAVPVLVGITLVAFLLIRLIPGDPVQVMLGMHATPDRVASLRAQLHLDQPLPAQYVSFVAGAVTFDLGDSIALKGAIAPILAGRIGVTAALLAYAVIISLIVAVPLAVLSAIRRNRWPDHVIRLFSTVTFAMPAFWLGLILILVFALELGWFPTSGLGRDLLGLVRGLTLPAITIGLYLAPILLRTLRSSLVETLNAEYIEAARARGLTERRIVLKHVMRNSLIAMITVLGVNVGFLISGSVIIENVFAIPGLGSLLVSSILARDFPVITALTLVFGVAVILVNLLTDLSYAALDPRVRL
jgi:peptide/nickel transport system permease protein